MVNGLEEYPYLHALLFLREFLDFAVPARGRKMAGYMLSSGQQGAVPLIVQMEARLSVD